MLKEYPEDLWANLAISTLYYKAEDEANAKRYLQNALFYYPQNTLATARLEALS